ncbi:MAG: MATE family efflux transporter [Burkholderiaceae bacterium]
MATETSRQWHGRVIRLAVPIILANLTQPVVSAVDTGVAGHLPNASYLGGVALGGLFFNFIYWGFGFLRMGTTGLTAQAHGAHDNDALRLTLVRALSLALAIGLVILLAQVPLLQAALTLLGGSAQVRHNALVYCQARIWSAPLALGNYAILGCFLGLQQVRLGLLLQLFINLVNIAAVFVLVFGMDLGLPGIGWATALADTAGFVLGLVLVKRLLPKGLSRLSWSRVLDRHALSQLMLINLNLFVRTICLLASFAWFTHAGALLGDVVLAANAILLNFQTFMAFALDGFAHASEALVGLAFGARDRKALRRAIEVTTLWAGVTAVAFALIYAFAGGRIVGSLTDLPGVREAAVQYLPYAAISPLISVWGFQFDGVFIGATCTRELMLSMMISAAAFGASVALLEPWLGNTGLWLALLILMAMRGATLGAFLPRVFDTANRSDPAPALST